MKEFSTAIAEVTEDQELPVEFGLDGQVIRAYRPTDGQIAMTMVKMGRGASDAQRMAAIVDFFVVVLDEDSSTYVVDRLFSRTDPLGLDQVEEVLEWLIEEWTGRPIQPPSASTSSRSSGGPKSKPRTPRSNSSASARASS